MPVNGIALATVATGAVFAYAGVTGKSVLASVQAIVSGKSPATTPNANPITPDASVTAAAGTGSGASIGAVAGGSTGNAGQYQSYAFSLFSQYGWGTDQQQYLIQLWNQESGWNPNAQNPSSTAYGIAQFLDTTWSSVGGTKTSNPQVQIQLGLKYISQRYGTPQMAWAHEVQNGWY